MTIEWALKRLRAGEKVRRGKWESGTYTFVNDHKILVFFLNEQNESRVKVVVQRLDWQDVQADDWESA